MLKEVLGWSIGCMAGGMSWMGLWYGRMKKHRMIRRMRSERMNELSDHKPKKSCDLYGEEEVERRDSEKKEEYKESTRVKWNERMERETGESSRM